MCCQGVVFDAQYTMILCTHPFVCIVELATQSLACLLIEMMRSPWNQVREQLL